MQHVLARSDSQFLCCTRVYFLCNLLWPKVQSHSDDSHVYATGPRYAHALAQARPTLSCIYLVHKVMASAIHVHHGVGCRDGKDRQCYIILRVRNLGVFAAFTVIQVVCDHIFTLVATVPTA